MIDGDWTLRDDAGFWPIPTKAGVRPLVGYQS